MCKMCWKEYGSPTNKSPDIEKAAWLISKIYETEVTGRPLHTSLHDWNIEGTWEPWPDHFNKVSWVTWEAALELCEIMNKLPLDDRASALALAGGYF